VCDARATFPESAGMSAPRPRPRSARARSTDPSAPAFRPPSDRALVAPSRRLALHGARPGTPNLAVLGRMMGLMTMAAGFAFAAWLAIPPSRWPSADPDVAATGSLRTAEPQRTRTVSAEP